MTLVDTSVWIDHLRGSDPDLQQLLDAGQVLRHRMVVGELAMGQFASRPSVLRMLNKLPEAASAHDVEVLAFVERNRLFGLGISYIDAHLLTSVRQTPNTSLWTRDKRMLRVAEELSISLREKR